MRKHWIRAEFALLFALSFFSNPPHPHFFFFFTVRLISRWGNNKILANVTRGRRRSDKCDIKNDHSFFFPVWTCEHAVIPLSCHTLLKIPSILTLQAYIVRRGWEFCLNILTTSLQFIPLFPPRVLTYVFRALYNMESLGCALCPVYLTARKLNVKYLPFPWYVTLQIPAVMGSSHIPPTGSLSLLVFSFFFPFPPPPCLDSCFWTWPVAQASA